MENGKINISKTEFGAYEVDIVGMMYLLKNKKIPIDSVVVTCMKSDKAFVFLDTFLVGESINDTYILYVEDDDDDSHVARLKTLPGLNVQVCDMPEDKAKELAKEILGDDYEEEDEMDIISPYLEADDLMMDATFLVYPVDILLAVKAEIKSEPKAAPKTENAFSVPQNIIHYEEALHRLKNGETVSLDKTGDGHFELVNPGDALSPEDILKGVWSLSHVSMSFPTVDEMADRLATFLSAVTPKHQQAVTKEDLMHDMTIAEFLNKLKDSSDN